MGAEAEKKKVEVEKKVEVKTAVYKVHVHCGQCARDIQTQFTEFQGVEEVKVDAGAGKVTVKGFGFDVEKLRVKVEKGCRKKVELIPPKKDIVTEVKTKKGGADGYNCKGSLTLWRLCGQGQGDPAGAQEYLRGQDGPRQEHVHRRGRHR